MPEVLTEHDDEPGREEEAVLRWRTSQFLRLVDDLRMARALAGSDADIGQARKLLERGATAEQITRILL